MQVFVTGSTGFVGGEVLRQLAAAGHQVVALVRPGSEGKLEKHPDIRIHPGDVTDPGSLPEGMRGCEAVIHLVGIIREFPDKGVTFERLHVQGTENVLRAAAASGTGRYLHMSANGARADGYSEYERTKWRAEQAVGDSGLEWTIFRPSLIFGPGSDLFSMLSKMVRLAPVVPVIGDGRYRLQPVALEQVAESFVRALSLPETVGRIFHLCGSEDYAYNEILDLIGKALGKDKVRKIHQPVSLVKPVVRVMEQFSAFPITSGQLTMLLEGNICDRGPWADTFGIEPISFAQGVKNCLGQ
ncbi:MAG: complex I NDUFA9 subunit family protein [Syntrophotaleaceae bacterium]